MHDSTKRLLERLTTYYQNPNPDFWDLRVNYVVGEWLREGKPNLDLVKQAGFGFIEHGSTTSGPIKDPEETERMNQIKSFEKLTLVGRQMANVCYNFSQKSPNEGLSERELESIKPLSKKWDEALNETLRDIQVLGSLTAPTVDQMSLIAQIATSTKNEELKEAGWELNHKITPGDVRHVLGALSSIVNQKQG